MKFTVATVIVLSALIVSPAFASDGPAVYKSKCAMCHGADGEGDTPAGKALKAKSLKEADAMKASDTDLIAIIKNGKGKMPAYSGKLADDDIKSTVAYIRLLQKK